MNPGTLAVQKVSYHCDSMKYGALIPHLHIRNKVKYRVAGVRKLGDDFWVRLEGPNGRVLATEGGMPYEYRYDIFQKKHFS